MTKRTVASPSALLLIASLATPCLVPGASAQIRLGPATMELQFATASDSPTQTSMAINSVDLSAIRATSGR